MDIPDYSTPASILEAQETESDAIDPRNVALGLVFRRVLAWVVEAKSVNAVGMRALTLARKVSPDLVDGATLADIAQQLGQGRQAAHRLDKELSRLFDLRSPLERSPEIKRRYSELWHERNTHRLNPSTDSNSRADTRGSR